MESSHIQVIGKDYNLFWIIRKKNGQLKILLSKTGMTYQTTWNDTEESVDSPSHFITASISPLIYLETSTKGQTTTYKSYFYTTQRTISSRHRPDLPNSNLYSTTLPICLLSTAGKFWQHLSNLWYDGLSYCATWCLMDHRGNDETAFGIA